LAAAFIEKGRLSDT